MDSTFLAIAIPAFGAIIGFSYIHNKVMRKVLLVCFAITWIASFVYNTAWEYRYEGLLHCLIISNDFPDSSEKYQSIKDLQKLIHDTIPDVEKTFRIKYEGYYSERYSRLIGDLMKQERDEVDYVNRHITALKIAFAFCFALSFFFDYVKKDKLKQSNKNSPNKDT